VFLFFTLIVFIYHIIQSNLAKIHFLFLSNSCLNHLDGFQSRNFSPLQSHRRLHRFITSWLSPKARGNRTIGERLSVSGETPRKPSFAVLKSIPCLPVNLSLMAGQVTPDDNAPFPGSLPRMSILVLKHSDTTRLTPLD